MIGVRLDCPLCGALVVDGPDPQPGACPACGAVYHGGAETSRGAVEAFLVSVGLGAPDPGALTRALFELEPDSAPARQIAITSDLREGFYLWWVFARPERGDIGTLIERVLNSG